MRQKQRNYIAYLLGQQFLESKGTSYVYKSHISLEIHKPYSLPLPLYCVYMFTCIKNCISKYESSTVQFLLGKLAFSLAFFSHSFLEKYIHTHIVERSNGFSNVRKRKNSLHLQIGLCLLWAMGQGSAFIWVLPALLPLACMSSVISWSVKVG